jgi:hypothetical protein
MSNTLKRGTRTPALILWSRFVFFRISGYKMGFWSARASPRGVILDSNAHNLINFTKYSKTHKLDRFKKKHAHTLVSRTRCWPHT